MAILTLKEKFLEYEHSPRPCQLDNHHPLPDMASTRPVLNNLLEILHVARNMMTTDRLLNPIKEHLHKGINEYELLFSD